MAEHRGRAEKIRRRLVSIPALFVATVVVSVTVPLWLPIALLIDAARLRFRMPIARLLAFGVCYCWVESWGVTWAGWLWATGRAGDPATNYALMARWSGALISSLETTTGIAPRIDGLDALDGGNAIVLARHVSLADSLLSGWATSNQARVWPRYVLKRELLFDPCLDIMGLRIPNHFVDRQASDGAAELDALREMAAGVGPNVIAVIFAEGTRSNDAKRARALEKIGEGSPARAERMAALRHLLPPRPAGSAALLEGAPGADVVMAWHTGFDGLDSFGGMIRKLAKPLPPVRFVMHRIPRSDVVDGEGFGDWLDEQWLRMDAEVDASLTA